MPTATRAIENDPRAGYVRVEMLYEMMYEILISINQCAKQAVSMQDSKKLDFYLPTVL